MVENIESSKESLIEAVVVVILSQGMFLPYLVICKLFLNLLLGLIIRATLVPDIILKSNAWIQLIKFVKLDFVEEVEKVVGEFLG